MDNKMDNFSTIHYIYKGTLSFPKGNCYNFTLLFSSSLLIICSKPARDRLLVDLPLMKTAGTPLTLNRLAALVSRLTSLRMAGDFTSFEFDELLCCFGIRADNKEEKLLKNIL